MSFDSELLDALAMSFVEAAMRGLEAQVLVDEATSDVSLCRREQHRPSSTKSRVADDVQGPDCEHSTISSVTCPLFRTTELCRPSTNPDSERCET